MTWPPTELANALDSMVGVGTKLAPGERVVFVTEIHAYDRVAQTETILYLSDNVYTTRSTDDPAGRRFEGKLTPPNVALDLLDGVDFRRSGSKTGGGFSLTNPRMDPARHPKGLEGLFDEWSYRYDFRERPMRSYAGLNSNPWSLFYPYYAGRVRQVTFDRDRVRWDVAPHGLALDVSLLRDAYGAPASIVVEYKPSLKNSVRPSATSREPAQVRRLWTSRGEKPSDGTGYPGSGAKDWQKKTTWLADDLTGVRKPLTLGECMGIAPQLISKGSDVYQYDAYGGQHGEAGDDGLQELFEGGLPSADGGPTWTEDPDVYGPGAFKKNGGAPDKPLHAHVKGIKFAGKQLLTQSGDLTHGDWTKSNVSVVAGQDDPLGRTGAFLVTDTSAAARGFLQQNYTVESDAQLSAESITSIYLREGTAGETRVVVLSNTGLQVTGFTVDWSTRTITAVDPSITAVITYDDGTWLRAEARGTLVDPTSVTEYRWFLYPDRATAAAVGNVYVWGPQFELGSGFDEAQFYKQTTDTPLTYIDQQAQLAEEVLYRAGHRPEGLDLLAFSAFDLDNPYAAGIHGSNDEELEALEAVESLVSPQGQLYERRDGRVSIREIAEPYDPTDTPARRYKAGDAKGKFDQETIPPVYRLFIGYAPIERPLRDGEALGAATWGAEFYSQPYRYVEIVDRGVGEKVAGARELTIETRLVHEADARAAGEKLFRVLRQERRRVTISPEKGWLQLDAGDRASLDLGRYGYSEPGVWKFGDGTTIEFEDGTSVEKENPAEGLPGTLVGYVDNPAGELNRSKMTFYV